MTLEDLERKVALCVLAGETCACFERGDPYLPMAGVFVAYENTDERVDTHHRYARSTPCPLNLSRDEAHALYAEWRRRDGRRT